MRYNEVAGYVPEKSSVTQLTIASLNSFVDEADMPAKHVAPFILLITLGTLVDDALFPLHFALVGLSNVTTDAFFSEKGLFTKFTLMSTPSRAIVFKLLVVSLFHVQSEQIALFENRSAKAAGVALPSDFWLAILAVFRMFVSGVPSQRFLSCVTFITAVALEGLAGTIMIIKLRVVFKCPLATRT